jgi:hypothetical protein
VIAVGPPRSGAAAGGDGGGRSSLGVGVVIDVGAVRRRRRHRSCRTERKEHTQTQKPDNFRFTASLFSILFFSSFHLSFPPPPFFLNIHKTTGSLTDANDRKFPRKTKKHKNKKKIGKMPREEEKEDP